MSDFFRTAMGQRFYEHTMPELVRQLRRLNENLERLADRVPATERVQGAETAGEPPTE